MSKKNIVLTGTSRGIGFELVKILGEQGHSILALSRNSQPVSELGLQNVYALGCDLNDYSSYSSIVEYVKKKFSRIDVLVNNAGALINKPFTDTTPKDFLEVYKTNVLSVSELIRTLLPFMDNSGHIVNISSMGGVQGTVKFPGLAAYSSSKGALITLTEILAEELKENGPCVNALALGAVQTEMLADAFPGYQAPISAFSMAEYIANFALMGNKYYNGKILQVSNSTP